MLEDKLYLYAITCVYNRKINMDERVRVEIYENYFKTNKFSDTAEEVPKSLPQ